MDSAAIASARAARRRRPVVVLAATAAWLLASAVLWVVAIGDCSVDCHEQNARKIWNAALIATIALVVWMAGPAVIAVFALAVGDVPTALAYLAVTAAAVGLAVLSEGAIDLLSLEWLTPVPDR